MSAPETTQHLEQVKDLQDHRRLERTFPVHRHFPIDPCVNSGLRISHARVLF